MSTTPLQEVNVWEKTKMYRKFAGQRSGFSTSGVFWYESK